MGRDVTTVREFLLAELARELASSMDGGFVSFEGRSVGKIFIAFGARKAATAVNRFHVQLERVDVSESAVTDPAHQFLLTEKGNKNDSLRAPRWILEGPSYPPPLPYLSSMNSTVMHVEVSGGRKGLSTIATFVRLFLGFGVAEQMSGGLLGGGERVKFLR